ncbi:SirB2 family protein [Vibrio sp. S12_S33]|uniref:SirB2 family protein n=1 Tax=Vibrio sp. S12_S33 TaxID=2720223 RepID=UPI00178767C4|nr:SirB2 family protein [Vibrio sp. S12_S33]MBD1565679.1 SirB2 family protein [Vibrio sp. S12_S33]
MYEGLKHFHLLTIGISALLLSVRYGLMMANSAWLQHPFLKRFPHIVDSLLLLSGIALVVMSGFIPFTPAAPWMTTKLTCVLTYIALGFFALKLGRNKLLRSFAFFGALGWLVMAGKIAVTKTPMFFG